jgi:hypothetical protein
MTTPDYRALCAELADELEGWIEGYLINDPADEYTIAAQAMVDRARALLDAPEAVGMTDEEHSVADYMRSEINVVESCAGFTDESTPVGEAWSRILGAMERSRYGNAHPARVPVTDEELDALERQCWIPTEVCNEAGCEYLLDHRRFARAVLARYGTAHTAPVPVGERPWERDGWCDDEGRCWWWRSDGVDEFWEFICLRYPVEHIAKLPDHISYGPCLPHWALPLPGDPP